MILELEANGQTDLNLRGQTVVYLAGAAQLLFVTEQGRFQIPAGGQVTLPSVFEKITVVNMTSAPTLSEVLFIEGEYQRLSDVSLVQIQGITNAITAHIASLPPVQVSTMPAVKVSTMPAVEVSQIPEVVQKDVGNVLTTSYTVNAGGVVVIPAKVGRKSILIQGYVDSIETTICRISDVAKSIITGEFFAVGGGLLAESKHSHSAALKVWNPSATDNIEIVVREEF
jgi:hypothetical protein